MTPLTIAHRLRRRDELEVRLAVVQAGEDRRAASAHRGSVIVRLRSAPRPPAGGAASPRATPRRGASVKSRFGREEAHQRPGEEPGDDDVEDRGEPEEEGEAAHRADRELEEHDGADEAGDVGGEDRAEGARERPLGGAAQRAAGLHLVLEPLEVHDVAVDRDADGHDDAGDAGQAQGHPEVGDDRVEQRRPHAQPEPPPRCRGPGSRRSCRGTRARGRAGRRPGPPSASPRRGSATRSARSAARG